MAVANSKSNKELKSKRVKVKRQTGNYSSHYKSIFQQFFAGLLIFFGFLLITYAASKNFEFNLKRETVNSRRETSQKPEYSRIKFINIPKISRNLMVEDGYFENGRWVVSDSGVSFYTDSSLPDESGNTVLYGHNKATILGGLVNVRSGDLIELGMENGELRNYEVFETKTIKPTDVSILSSSTDTILTIYTCSGFLDSARFVVLANPVGE